MARRQAAYVGAVLVFGLSVGACAGSDEPASEPSTSASTTTVPAPVGAALPGTHVCVPADARNTRIAWSELRNPILATDGMAKDQAVVHDGERWYLLFSSRSTDPRYSGLGEVSSTDWRTWEPVPERPEGGGSPDVTRTPDGRLIVTYQDDPANTDVSKPYYRLADTVDGFASEQPVRLYPELFPSERMIDTAFAHTNRGLFAMFKRGAHTAVIQHTEVVYSPSGSPDGPWQLLGEPDFGPFENYQFIPIDGTWHLLGTSIPVHAPQLYRLAGDPAKPKSWLHWKLVRTIEVPEEEWNGGGTVPGLDYERANSAYLCDARAADGYFYLLYAGSTELTTNEGRGHAKIGVARSKDLEHWTVPPD
jgi:hypothetical protein